MTIARDVRHPHVAPRWLAGALLAAATACSGDATPPTTPTPTAGALAAVSGSGQSGVVGSALTAPLVVQVTSASGAAIAGAAVTFAVTSGSATLAPTTATTSATGQATTQVTLGATAGSVVVTASVQGTALATTFAVTARAATSTATTSAACDVSGLTPLAAGQATTPAGTSLCVSGGTAGAEYALVPFNGATTATRRATFTVSGAGIGAATTALTDVGATGAPTLAVAPRSGAEAFEARLRATALTALAPRLASARTWYAGRRTGTGARLSVIPASATVGSLVSLNANADDACARPRYRAGRVMAITSKAIVVADTLNPSGGYTTADYQSIATTFDTLVDAVDTRNFGQPTDIDGNGHVVLFFTSAVNALTPKNANYYIGGFFYSRDLFPTTGTAALDACAGSNVAEMFYLLVPDPSGTINGNRFSKTFVTSAAIGTTAHEYEHLINASRRVYVNTDAEDLEETWLDEGLAHVAEELLFYARAGLASRQNLDATAIRRSAVALSAFNDVQSANYARYEEYLTNPTGNSPYADDDSLATRGATWAFLRYAAGRQTTSEAAVWQALVNSTTTGLANLRRVFGSDVTSLFRDWSTSLLLDDVSGADARFLDPSWNYRAVYTALDGRYPLKTTSLGDGTAATVTIAGGSAAYLRFTVGAGRTGSVSWGALPSGVQLTLVRLQ